MSAFVTQSVECLRQKVLWISASTVAHVPYLSGKIPTEVFYNINGIILTHYFELSKVSHKHITLVS